MSSSARRAALALVLVAAGTPAAAESRACRVEPFAGATSGPGAVTRMTLANDGTACRIENFGVPAERKHPASTGTIIQAPAHGTATFNAPFVRYVPAPGFAGEDEFAYEARATGNVDQQVVLRVRVKVTVHAP